MCDDYLRTGESKGEEWVVGKACLQSHEGGISGAEEALTMALEEAPTEETNAGEWQGKVRAD